MKSETTIRSMLAELEQMADADALNDFDKADDDALMATVCMVTTLQWVLDLPNELDDTSITRN